SRVAVIAARTIYRLPYRSAEMRAETEASWVVYRSRRPDGSAEFAARYRPAGSAFTPKPGTLEHFLTQRYALYVVLRDRTVVRGDIHHHPWALHPAEALIERNAVASAEGIGLPDRSPLLHFSNRQDALVWPPAMVG